MKLIDFIIGILLLFFGAILWIGKVGGMGDKLKEFAVPGSMQYQIVIIALGVLLVLYSLAGRKKAI